MAPISRNYVNQAPKFFDSYLLKDLLELPEVNTLKSGNRFPAVNIKESEGSFEVEVAAPGLQKENFNVRIEKNTLTISSVGDDQKQENKPEEKYTLKEFSSHAFERKFTFPEEKVDVEKVKGSYENGVLKLVLPKKAEKIPKTRKIEIQ